MNNQFLQQETLGIRWVEKLSWKEVLKKAKKEKKYIFIDCYTTWCGPCKSMEKEVFNKKEVGDYFNQNFLCVRLQLDKTKNDNEQIRNWYSTASTIQKEQGIPSYPTFLFFSPQGNLAFRESGFKTVRRFLEMGETALSSKTATYLTYYSWLAKYLRGYRDYRTMAGIADTAKQLHQTEIAFSVAKEYRPYLLKRSEGEWYTRSNLSFMSAFIEGTNDPFFKIFYSNNKIVDSILDKPGFSQNVVDEIILKEEIEPFTKPGRGYRLSTDKPKGESEPDWASLIQKIKLKYSETHARRIILRARVQWYKDHEDWSQCANVFSLYVNEFPFIYIDNQIATFINSVCWQAIFKRSVDKGNIDAAITCMYSVVKKFNFWADAMDTYSNLLYKSGKVQEAVRLEEEALRMNPGNEGIQSSLIRMKQGKATWPHYIDKGIFDEGILD